MQRGRKPARLHLRSATRDHFRGGVRRAWLRLGIAAAVLSLLPLPRAADAGTIPFTFDPAFAYTLTLRSTVQVSFGTTGTPPASSFVGADARLTVGFSPAATFTLLSVQHTVNGTAVSDISTTFGVDATDSGTLGVFSFSGTAGDLVGGRSIRSIADGTLSGTCFNCTEGIAAQAIEVWDFSFGGATAVVLDFAFIGSTTEGPKSATSVGGLVRVTRVPIGGGAPQTVVDQPLAKADLVAAPEPMTAALLSLGLAGVAFLGRRRAR